MDRMFHAESARRAWKSRNSTEPWERIPGGRRRPGRNMNKVCSRRRFWWTLFWSLFTSVPHRKNLEQRYTNFIYKTFAFRIPWKKPQLFTGRIYAPTTEILFPTTNIKFLRLVVLVVGNKSSLFTERSKYINRLEELVFYSCVRNLIIQEYLILVTPRHSSRS